MLPLLTWPFGTNVSHLSARSVEMPCDIVSSESEELMEVEVAMNLSSFVEMVLDVYGVHRVHPAYPGRAAVVIALFGTYGSSA